MRLSATATLQSVVTEYSAGESATYLLLYLADGSRLRIPTPDTRTPDTLLKRLPREWTVSVEPKEA